VPFWKRLCDSETGAIAPLAAILLTVVLGFAGLGVEVGLWQLERRTMQGAADAAASSGAHALLNGQDPAEQARAVAASYGYSDGVEGVVIQVNVPPVSGSKAGVQEAVEVIITKPEAPLLSGMFLDGPVDLGARAVASVENSGGEFCVLALEVTAESTELTGTAHLNMPNCGLAVNSANPEALRMTGTSRIDASNVSIVGGYETTGGATINTTAAPGPETGMAPLADPYADVEVPDFSGCNYSNFSLSGSGTATLLPGVYCNGLKISGSRTITMQAGTYFIDRGAFDVSGSPIIVGNGPITIVLTSSTGSDVARLDLTGDHPLQIEAPTSGPLAGIAIYQDRNASSTGTNKITGSTSQSITGAVYFPKQSVSWRGTSASGSGGCTQLIARAITFTGTSDFNNNCAGKGTSSISTSTAALFE
jgi:hypothetical protein